MTKDWVKILVNSYLQRGCSYIDFELTGDFTHEKIKILVDELVNQDKKHTITGIRLSDKELDDACAKELSRLTWLKSLDVACNNLSDTSIKSMADSLRDLNMLSVTGNERITNIASLKNLKNLRELRASFLPLLKMDGNEWVVLVRETQLEDLMIEDSNVSREITEKIQWEIENSGRDPDIINAWSDSFFKTDSEPQDHNKPLGESTSKKDEQLQENSGIVTENTEEESKRFQESSAIETENTGNNNGGLQENPDNAGNNNGGLQENSEIATENTGKEDKQSTFRHFVVNYLRKSTPKHPQEEVGKPNSHINTESNEGCLSKCELI